MTDSFFLLYAATLLMLYHMKKQVNLFLKRYRIGFRNVKHIILVSLLFHCLCCVYDFIYVVTFFIIFHVQPNKTSSTLEGEKNHMFD
ncbi:hypothetical protein AAZX31_19G030100 [Glycine max]